jgi:hypothetical protein
VGEEVACNTDASRILNCNGRGGAGPEKMRGLTGCPKAAPVPPVALKNGQLLKWMEWPSIAYHEFGVYWRLAICVHPPLALLKPSRRLSQSLPLIARNGQSPPKDAV